MNTGGQVKTRATGYIFKACLIFTLTQQTCMPNMIMIYPITMRLNSYGEVQQRGWEQKGGERGTSKFHVLADTCLGEADTHTKFRSDRSNSTEGVQ